MAHSRHCLTTLQHCRIPWSAHYSLLLYFNCVEFDWKLHVLHWWLIAIIRTWNICMPQLFHFLSMSFGANFIGLLQCFVQKTYAIPFLLGAIFNPNQCRWPAWIDYIQEASDMSVALWTYIAVHTPTSARFGRRCMPGVWYSPQSLSRLMPPRQWGREGGCRSCRCPHLRTVRGARKPLVSVSGAGLMADHQTYAVAQLVWIRSGT